MNKQKYIERNTPYSHHNKKYKKLKHKHIIYDNSEILPKRESMRRSNQDIDYWMENGFVNWQHITNFFDERIGYDWDVVYSEFISKIRKHKYLYRIKLYNSSRYYSYFIDFAIFENDLPYNNYGRLLYNILFVDEKNIISFYETEEELLIEYRKRKKLKNRLLIIKKLLE